MNSRIQAALAVALWATGIWLGALVPLHLARPVALTAAGLALLAGGFAVGLFIGSAERN